MEDRYFDNVPKEIREYAAEKNVRLYCLDIYSECSITDSEMLKLQNLFYEHLPDACGPYSPATATEREIAQRYPDSVYARAVEHLDHPNTPKNIESIVIPAGVTEICGGAFYDASDLKSVTFAERPLPELVFALYTSKSAGSLTKHSRSCLLPLLSKETRAMASRKSREREYDSGSSPFSNSMKRLPNGW
jgi:hypothetical protein